MNIFNNNMTRVLTTLPKEAEQAIENMFETAEEQASKGINDLDNSVSTALAELSALETRLVGEVESRTSMLTQVRDRKAKLQSIVTAQEEGEPSDANVPLPAQQTPAAA